MFSTDTRYTYPFVSVNRIPHTGPPPEQERADMPSTVSLSNSTFPALVAWKMGPAVPATPVTIVLAPSPRNLIGLAAPMETFSGYVPAHILIFCAPDMEAAASTAAWIFEY